MLRLYKPIVEHEIFKLHELFSHVVKEVWCKACEEESCEDKLQEEFKKIYHYAYINKEHKLEQEVEEIYKLFKALSEQEKQLISQAFDSTNQIEDLCEGRGTPVYLDDMPEVVKKRIKPLLKWCYEKLLEKKKVSEGKIAYYKDLKDHNGGMKTCPCCGLIDFESGSSSKGEAFDHYFSKGIYPFASINFLNLIPICHKCNSGRKGKKNPIKDNKIAFYPFSTATHKINIEIETKLEVNNEDKQLHLSDLTVKLIGDKKKVETWDWLFAIKERYKGVYEDYSGPWFRQLINRYKKNKKRAIGLSLTDIIEEQIEDCQDDLYLDKKFLKIAFLNVLKKDPAILEVYQNKKGQAQTA